MKKRSAGIVSGSLCFGEHGVERFGEFGFQSDTDAVVVVGQDQDAFKERLVKQSADVFGGAGVGGVAVGCEVEGESEVPFDGFPSGVGGFEFGGDSREALADAVLFLTEEVDRDGSGVVRLHELAAFTRQLLVSFLKFGPPCLDVVACVGEFGPEVGFDVVAEGAVELNSQVEVFDFAFDFVDQHGTLRAGRPLGVSSSAEEVRVDVSAG